MSQTSNQINKIFLLLTFLLLNGIITSCGSCSKEKGKLEAEEKVLKEKLQKQMTLEGWKQLELQINGRKTSTQQELEKEIEEEKTILQAIDKIKSEDYQYVEPKYTVVVSFLVAAYDLQGTSADVSYAKKKIDDDLSSVLQMTDPKDIPQVSQQLIKPFVLDPKIQQLLKDQNTTIKVKEYFSDWIKLLENLKKQAAL